MARRRRRWLVAAAAFALVVAAGWVALDRRDAPAPKYHFLATTVDYQPGLGADIFQPAGRPRRLPVVVLIPGGGWRTADRTGLRPLADLLAHAGIFVVAATYRAHNAGAHYPTDAQDVRCAIDFAVARAHRLGFAARSVTVLGHSAGGQLAALVALVGSRVGGRCAYPDVAVDGLIGVAGVYDISAAPDLAIALIGKPPYAARAAWREANPLNWVRQRTGAHALRVLLAHGTADSLVPISQSTGFARALRAAGHPVRLVLVRGATHGSIYKPPAIGALVRDWVLRLG